VYRGAIIVAILLYLVLYLMSLQNIYLRDRAPDILSFVVPHLWSGIELGFKGDAKGFVDAGLGLGATDSGMEITNFIIAFCCFAFIVVALLLLGASLRHAARDARNRLRERLANARNPVPEWLGIGREDALTRLDTRAFWPVDRPRRRDLVLMLVVGALAIVFYKLLLVIAGLALMAFVVRPLAERLGLRRSSG